MIRGKRETKTVVNFLSLCLSSIKNYKVFYKVLRIFTYWFSWLGFKALHSELFTELSSRFLSRNEFFVIFEFRVERHFFVIFGKFGNSSFPKFPYLSELFRTFSELLSIFFRNFPNFFWIFPNFLTQKQVFLLDFKFYVVFLEIFEIYVQFWLISKLFPNLNFRTYFRTFSQNFREFENSCYFRKISELQKWNFSETRKNEKFGNFCLTQGLT